MEMSQIRKKPSKPISSINLSANLVNSDVSKLTEKLFDSNGVYAAFLNDRISNIEMQLAPLGNVAKKYKEFCDTLGDLSLCIKNSLEDCVQLCEYNGSKNEEFFDLERKLFNETIPLSYKRKKDAVMFYELYGAIAKPYDKEDYYDIEEMVFLSKKLKKRLNTNPAMALGECYKILSEIKRNPENKYSSYDELDPEELLDAECAFIDSNVCKNGGMCYKIVSDKYLAIIFKITIRVPLYISGEEDIFYQTLDMVENKKRINKKGITLCVESLKRYYKNLMKERFGKLLSKNNKNEAREKIDLENSLDDERKLIADMFNNAKSLVTEIENGNISYSHIDVYLRNVADSVTELKICFDEANEYLSNIVVKKSIKRTIRKDDETEEEIEDRIDTEPNEYLKKYNDTINRIALNTLKRSGLTTKTKTNFDCIERPLVIFLTTGVFDMPLSPREIRMIGKRQDVTSSDFDKKLSLSIDRGRDSNVPQIYSEYKNGQAVITCLSKTLDRTNLDRERASHYQVPGKVFGVSKLTIFEKGFTIYASCGE